MLGSDVSDELFLEALDKGGQTSACQITVMSVPASEYSSELQGFAKRVLQETDVIMTTSFGGSLEDMAKKWGPDTIVSLSTYRNLASDEEKALFDATTNEIAKLALCLDAIQVSSANIGSCWALGLRAPIFRELYAVHTLNHLLAKNTARLVILVPSFGAPEYALIARLMGYQAEGKVNLRGVCELKGGILRPISTQPIHDVRQALARRRNDRNFSVMPTSVEKMTGMPKAISNNRPTEADVLFLQLTDNPMFQRNVGAVLAAVKEQGGTPAVLVANASVAPEYAREVQREKIYLFNPKLAWEDEAMVARLQTQVMERVEVCALDVAPLETWVPLFAAHDKTGMATALKKLLVFQSALNLMRGWVKPRSLYLTQSPDTNAFAYLAATSAQNYCNSYYSFSGLLTEDTRSLPFVAPTALLAYGEQDKSMVSARNDRAGNFITVVGTPSYDVLNSMDVETTRKEFRAELGLPISGKIIVLTTTRDDPAHEDIWLARFLRWANEEGFICMLVRARRAGRKDYTTLETMAAGKQWDKVRFITEDRMKAIAGADIVITDQAEAAVEAVCLDKMIVHVRLASSPEGSDSLVEGIGFEVSSESALRDVVGGILMDDDFMPDDMKEKRKSFKAWINSGDEGGASEKMASILLSKERVEPAFDNPFAEKFVLSNRLLLLKSLVQPADFSL